jgi:hypothetical protein
VIYNGGTLLIGGYKSTDNGPESGTAYLYSYDSVGKTWNEKAKLLPSDGQLFDQFGWALGLTNGMALVGAHWDDRNGIDSGSIYVFKTDIALNADSYQIPADTGGSINMFLSAGPGNGNRNYILLGSLSGIWPGTPLPGGMATLPLNWDFFSSLTVFLANSAILQNSQGVLDSLGSSTAVLNLPPVPGAQGTRIYFAIALNSPWNYASNSIMILITPEI